MNTISSPSTRSSSSSSSSSSSYRTADGGDDDDRIDAVDVTNIMPVPAESAVESLQPKIKHRSCTIKPVHVLPPTILKSSLRSFRALVSCYRYISECSQVFNSSTKRQTLSVGEVNPVIYDLSRVFIFYRSRILQVAVGHQCTHHWIKKLSVFAYNMSELPEKINDDFRDALSSSLIFLLYQEIDYEMWHRACNTSRHNTTDSIQRIKKYVTVIFDNLLMSRKYRDYSFMSFYLTELEKKKTGHYRDYSGFYNKKVLKLIESGNYNEALKIIYKKGALERKDEMSLRYIQELILERIKRGDFNGNENISAYVRKLKFFREVITRHKEYLYKFRLFQFVKVHMIGNLRSALTTKSIAMSAENKTILVPLLQDIYDTGWLTHSDGDDNVDYVFRDWAQHIKKSRVPRITEQFKECSSAGFSTEKQLPAGSQIFSHPAAVPEYPIVPFPAAVPDYPTALHPAAVQHSAAVPHPAVVPHYPEMPHSGKYSQSAGSEKTEYPSPVFHNPSVFPACLPQVRSQVPQTIEYSNSHQREISFPSSLGDGTDIAMVNSASVTGMEGIIRSPQNDSQSSVGSAQISADPHTQPVQFINAHRSPAEQYSVNSAFATPPTPVTPLAPVTGAPVSATLNWSDSYSWGDLARIQVPSLEAGMPVQPGIQMQPAMIFPFYSTLPRSQLTAFGSPVTVPAPDDCQIYQYNDPPLSQPELGLQVEHPVPKPPVKQPIGLEYLENLCGILEGKDKNKNQSQSQSPFFYDAKFTECCVLIATDISGPSENVSSESCYDKMMSVLSFIETDPKGAVRKIKEVLQECIKIQRDNGAVEIVQYYLDHIDRPLQRLLKILSDRNSVK